ncbi:DUF6894 family protein [Tardiphaga sp. 709]|uniref:DUF6894 family protein n=1 Tax=Tardiphaga sp. 709 TaxID=3076039 RepID=UPI0028EDCE10|nr:hypothetical protein [Tardiphaga sp. 709]WNV10072.1 hypothetical protein RSO67_02425 [Tardiphaga sp. 709]
MRYFFNLVDGTKLPDVSGIDFATDEAAIAHAHGIAFNIVNVSPNHNGPQRFVSVVQEGGQEVVRVPVHKEHARSDD